MPAKYKPRRVSLGKRKALRSTSQKIRYLNIIDDNCELNTLALIDKAKRSAAFGPVPWDEPVWTVTSSEVQRGHKQRNLNLNFTSHRVEYRPDSRIGEAFSNSARFADLVKAIVRLRKEIGRQCANNQNELIIGFRYLYDELQDSNFDLKEITQEKFNAAVKAVKKREKKISAYKRIQRLEEIARLLDENGLVRNKLDWRCSSNPRPPGMRHDLIEDDPKKAKESTKRTRLPGDGIIEAVAYLYHHIPRAEWADRVRVCLISLLVITGLRIGELLTLPARRVQTEDGTGRRYIVYYPEKGAPPTQKWLMTAGGELAEAMIDELLDLTADPRSIAKWLSEHPGSVRIEGFDLTQPCIKVSTIGAALGIAGGATGARGFLSVRKLQIVGNGNQASVSTQALISALRAESFEGPVNVVRNTGETLQLCDALACAFRNEFHSNRATRRYAVAPISEQQLSDFIRHRGGQPAAFERYGLEGPDGSALRVNSHAFRHWLNDLLDRGGLSDVEQAVYFGRRNPKDNRAYQHVTPAERARKAREDLKAGTLLGPVAKQIAHLPVERQDIVLAARVQAVHVVPGGACFHQFSQSPCPNQMACKDGCGDFHWQTDDPVAKRELEFERTVLKIAVETAEREVAEESWGADNWLQHNRRKLEQVEVALADGTKGKRHG